ncbi:MAG TPA: DUF6125 family protein [Candidatus Lokiarchaeia archaeon]
MKEISDKDKIFYFERNFFTLDGLWMIETERETNWDTALKIDKAVWTKLLKIIIKRIKNYLKIETNTLSDLIEILTFRWSIEGWSYTVKNNDKNRVYIEINDCPYKTIMDKNPDRNDKVPLICRNMCIPFYKEIVEDFNPNIIVERNKFMGLGDPICNFDFKLKL